MDPYDVSLKCDYPSHVFTDVKMLTYDYTSQRYADLPLKRNGTFHYNCNYSVYHNPTLVKWHTYCAIFSVLLFLRTFDLDGHFNDCFIVSGIVLLLSGICCITCNTKPLGLLTEWEGRLRVSYEAAYNMIHLTPIQQLGSSQSAYSISDHLALCDRYLPADYKPQDISVTYTGMSWLHILHLSSIKPALKLWSVVTSVII